MAYNSRREKRTEKTRKRKPMKNELEKYKKVKRETAPKETYSVFLETRQIEFLRKHSINLSRLVRDVVDRLMRDVKK